MWPATYARAMAKHKGKNDDKRVERLKEEKARIRDNYAWMPFMDWFKREKRPEKIEGVQLEKNDVLAMIIAALSLILPWVLGGAAIIALLMALMQWGFGA